MFSHNLRKKIPVVYTLLNVHTFLVVNCLIDILLSFSAYFKNSYDFCHAFCKLQPAIIHNYNIFLRICVHFLSFSLEIFSNLYICFRDFPHSRHNYPI